MPLAGRVVVPSTIVLLLIGFFSLLGIVGMTIWLSERARVNFDDVIEARDLRASAVELRNAVHVAESSQRGYLLTNNEIYLAPYGNAKSQAYAELDGLKRVAQRFAPVEMVTQRLSAILAEKFAEMDQTIDLKRERRDAEVLAIVRTNRGKALMDEANVFFTGLIRAADERLTVGVNEQKTNANMLRWVSIVGGLVIILVVGAAMMTVLRHASALARAHQTVETLNETLEARVAKRTADLALANEEIQRFAYIVTHDLRAPLVNIMGFTSELEGGVKSLSALIDKVEDKGAIDPAVEHARIAAREDLPEAIGFIRSSTKKMDNLINAILKLSREGRRSLRPERIEIVELVQGSVAALRHQITEADGKIDLRIETPVINSDRMSLEQIVGNLLDNAIKYREKSRPLRIEVSARATPGDRIEIGIADNGRGIADQDRERVFDLFRRAGAMLEPGEGIGLAHVRAMVRNLGGDVTVTSTLGEGATFLVALPARLQLSGGSL